MTRSKGNPRGRHTDKFIRPRLPPAPAPSRGFAKSGGKGGIEQSIKQVAGTNPTGRFKTVNFPKRRRPRQDVFRRAGMSM